LEKAKQLSSPQGVPDSKVADEAGQVMAGAAGAKAVERAVDVGVAFDAAALASVELALLRADAAGTVGLPACTLDPRASPGFEAVQLMVAPVTVPEKTRKNSNVQYIAAVGGADSSSLCRHFGTEHVGFLPSSRTVIVVFSKT
jgi:hypothetical protein